MNDPYKVLGVSPNASEEEIKKAYHDLVRKYHPDNYHDNPLSDLAQEKMKEINEAYDALTKTRGSGGGGEGQYRGQSYSGYTGSRSGVYAKVRNHINLGNVVEAERLLNLETEKNAEWHFLMGSVAYRKGWMDEAYRYIQTACAMDPGNTEYRQAMEHMSGGGPFGNMAGGFGPLDCCTSMMCANCCCDCMAGGC